MATATALPLHPGDLCLETNGKLKAAVLISERKCEGLLFEHGPRQIRATGRFLRRIREAELSDCSHVHLVIINFGGELNHVRHRMRNRENYVWTANRTSSSAVRILKDQVRFAKPFTRRLNFEHEERWSKQATLTTAR